MRYLKSCPTYLSIYEEADANYLNCSRDDVHHQRTVAHFHSLCGVITNGSICDLLLLQNLTLRIPAQDFNTCQIYGFSKSVFGSRNARLFVSTIRELLGDKAH